MRTTKRPDWARTHHTKPRRVSGRRERQQLRRISTTGSAERC